MARELTFRNFLKEFGMLVGAVATVIAVFFGLGYIKSTNFLGLSGILDSRLSFFATAFLFIGFISAGWIILQRSRA